jgi:hypothetical protein
MHLHSNYKCSHEYVSHKTANFVHGFHSVFMEKWLIGTVDRLLKHTQAQRYTDVVGTSSDYFMYLSSFSAKILAEDLAS